MTHLVKTVTKKNQALTSIWDNLAFSQRKLEYSHLHNASLTHKLADCTNITFDAVSHSFENALQQVEHFHHPLIISRGKSSRIKWSKMERSFLYGVRLVPPLPPPHTKSFCLLYNTLWWKHVYEYTIIFGMKSLFTCWRYICRIMRPWI